MSHVLRAARRLVSTPAFSFLTIVTLGIGLGAVTLAFTLVDSVLLRPLPYRAPEALVRLLAFDRKEAQVEWLSWAEVTALHSESRVLEDVAVTTVFPATLRTADGPERVDRGFASFNYFPLLGVEPIVGGLFLEGDEQQALLAEGLWRSRFDGREDVIGESIEVNGSVYTVAGVLPDTVYTHDLGSSPAELWLPQPIDRESSSPHFRIFTAVGRLAPGASLAQARQELETLQGRLAAERPEVYEGWGAHTDALRDSVVGDKGGGLVLLFGAVCLVLLIMSVNLANLMMSRFLGRRREFATRLALGDSAKGVLRDATLEGGVLALLGGALGTAIAVASLDAFPRFLPFALPREEEVAAVADARLVLIALGFAAAVTVLFAVVPAFLVLRGDWSSALRSGARGAVGGVAFGGRLRRAVIALQVAMSIPLLVAAGLLTESVAHLSERSLGLQPDGLVNVRVTVPLSQYPESSERARFFRELLSDVRNVPGVEQAGATVQVPFVAEQADRTRFRFLEEPERPADERSRALLQVVSDGYFETLGTRLVAGRDFDNRDTSEGTPVMIVSEALVRRELGGRDPLGLHIETEITMTPNEPTVRRVIGVVEDIPHFGPAVAVEPQIFVPHAQAAFGSMGVMVRSRLPVESVAAETRAIARRLEAQASVDEVTSLRAALDGTLGQPRFYSGLLLVFAATATFLACLGLYGLLTFAVASRRRELGLRAALGATPGSLVALVVRNGLEPTLIGAGLGVALSIFGMELVSSMLHGVSPLDVSTFSVAVGLLMAFACVAALIPGRRAARLDPIEALRDVD